MQAAWKVCQMYLLWLAEMHQHMVATKWKWVQNDQGKLLVDAVLYCSLAGYRKIQKISPGACIFQRPFFEGLIFGGAYIRRGLSREGYLRFKIDWASLNVGSKFTVLALFYFVFEGNFLRTSPQGAYIWRGDLTERFLYYRFGGLIFGVAYFRNFTAP